MDKGAERTALKADFLARAGLPGAALADIPGDASTRSYARLTGKAGEPLILMDAPPAAESKPAGPEATPQQRQAMGYNAMARLAACRVDAFAGAAAFLRSRGLSAPEVLAIDVDQGFALIEDLGDGLFARLIEQGAPPAPFYETAVDLLIGLHAEPPPAELAFEGGAWPLLPYDDMALDTGLGLFFEWLPKYAQRPAFGGDAHAEWRALWAPVRAAGHRGAEVFTHRDYHAENLLWLEDRQGLARVGLLDFQDAVRAHRAWDLLSLLQDARREVAPELEAAMLARYLAAHPGLDRDTFLQDYAGLAALNNARIIGIFARQIVGFGKPRYQAFMPRMWRLVRRNLSQPGMEGLKAWFARHVGEEAMI